MRDGDFSMNAEFDEMRRMEQELASSSLQRPCCASGPATLEKRSTEPWVLEAARELAMDSAHIPCIAQIIQRHVPPHNSVLGDTPTDKKL